MQSSVGESPGEELLVFFVGIGLEDADGGRGGMSVGRGHQNVLHGKAALLMNDLFRVVENLAINHAAVRNDDRQFVGAIIEHERARMQLVVQVRADVVVHVAVDGQPHPGRDVAGGCSRAKYGICANDPRRTCADCYYTENFEKVFMHVIPLVWQ